MDRRKTNVPYEMAFNEESLTERARFEGSVVAAKSLMTSANQILRNVALLNIRTCRYVPTRMHIIHG